MLRASTTHLPSSNYHKHHLSSREERTHALNYSFALFKCTNPTVEYNIGHHNLYVVTRLKDIVSTDW